MSEIVSLGTLTRHPLQLDYNRSMAVPHILTEKMAAYRAGLRQSLSRPLTAEEQAALETAWRAAREVAQRLVKQHGAERVILFGSVARRRPLRRESDIDLAVEGMPMANFYQIVGDLRTDEGREIDLVRLETLRESFRKIIALEGVLLAHAAD